MDINEKVLVYFIIFLNLFSFSTGERDENGNFFGEPIKIDPGINFKVGITSTLTFDATVNPDFSQVEADAPQIDVNTRFPIFIPEKRPFFLEGQDIFATPFTVVHTRQIVKPEYGYIKSGGAYYLRFRYSGRNLYYGLSHSSVNPDFEADSGFVYRTDYKKYSTWLGYSFKAEDDTVLLREWGPSFYGNFYYDYIGNPTEWDTSGDLYFSLSNNVTFDVYTSLGYLDYSGIDFYPSYTSFSFDTSYSQTVSGGFSLYYGKEVNYNPDRLILGNSSGGSLYLTLKFGENFRNSFTYSRSKLTDPFTDDMIFDVSIFRNSLTYQFNRDLAFRSIIDYNSYGNRVGANLLFTWTPNPGTSFFIGYDTRLFQEETGIYETDRNIFFMKMSYLFQL